MKGVKLKPAAILGAGSWGTALALYLGRRGQTIKLWSIDTSEINEMLSDGRNRFLPDFSLPDEIKPTADLAEAVTDVDDVIVVVPSVGFRSTLNKLKPLISAKTRITCATKGLDADTGKLLSEVVDETLGKEHKFAMLSGPSFAREVAAGLPAAVVSQVTIKILLTILLSVLIAQFFASIPAMTSLALKLAVSLRMLSPLPQAFSMAWSLAPMLAVH